MSEWIETPLASVIYPLETGKRPSGGANSETEGVPSLGGENIDAAGKMSYSNVNRISPTYARMMSRGKLKVGDTLINKDGAQTGKVAQYDGAFAEAWVNEHVFIVRSRPEKVHPDYLFYTMLDGYAQRQIAARITGSAQPGLNSDFATAVKVKLPQETEAQAKISGVLRALDIQIEATEALLAKQEQVRTGLMQDLFTHGVDEHGQLRPSCDQAPHLYHQTELGWLPLGWEVGTLLSYAAEDRNSFVNGPFGSDLLSSELQSEGVPVIYVRDIAHEEYARVSTVCVSQRKANQLAFCTVKNGDVLIAKVGDPPCMAAPYLMSEPSIVTQDVIRLRPSRLGDHHFLSALLNSTVGISAIRRIIVEGTRSRVSLTEFKKLPVPVVPQFERVEIGEALTKALEISRAYKAELASMRLQKSGLMQDLLTGKVSVAPLLESAVA